MSSIQFIDLEDLPFDDPGSAGLPPSDLDEPPCPVATSRTTDFGAQHHLSAKDTIRAA